MNAASASIIAEEELYSTIRFCNAMNKTLRLHREIIARSIPAPKSSNHQEKFTAAYTLNWQVGG